MRGVWAMPLVCLAVVGAGCGGTPRHSADGPLFAGSGAICASGSTVRFQGRSDLVASPPPTVCDGGIPLLGFDLGRLTGGTRWHGLRTGAAYVVGVYRHGALTVTAQGAPRPERGGLRVGRLPRHMGRAFAATRMQLEAAAPRDGIYEVSPAISRRGRPLVAIRVMLVTPQLRALLRTMPAGLVRVLPSLRRIGGA